VDRFVSNQDQYGLRPFENIVKYINLPAKM